MNFIKKLNISNFKSIKNLHLETKRVNVFIGEPNSGKTNIIEALSFLGMSMNDQYNFKEVFRFDSIDDLFPDSDVSNPIKVFTDDIKFVLEYEVNQAGAISNQFLGQYFKKKEEILLNYHLRYDGTIDNPQGQFSNNICFYSFKKHKDFRKHFRPFLNPPFGDNIPSLLLSNSPLKKLVSDIFKEKGFKLELKPKENKMGIAKMVDGDIYSYPYFSVSETLQRIVFMVLAIESNKNMVLIFDEPESNTFPFYTKYIAERIALDKSNQYFLTTHNPYLLNSIIEKTPSSELNVIVTTMKKFETKCYPLNSKQKEQAIEMGADLFFNIQKFTK